MTTPDLHDPLFATYAVCAAVLILKGVAMSWLTVARMMQVRGAFRAPEDLRKTTFNPEPHPGQLAPNDTVDRVRRIQLNDLESVPYFLVAAFLFVLCSPPLLLARLLLYGFVVSRLLHFWAYSTARNHETRATFWSIGSVILVIVTAWVLVVAVSVAF